MCFVDLVPRWDRQALNSIITCPKKSKAEAVDDKMNYDRKRTRCCAKALVDDASSKNVTISRMSYGVQLKGMAVPRQAEYLEYANFTSIRIPLAIRGSTAELFFKWYIKASNLINSLKAYLELTITPFKPRKEPFLLLLFILFLILMPLHLPFGVELIGILVHDILRQVDCIRSAWMHRLLRSWLCSRFSSLFNLMLLLILWLLFTLKQVLDLAWSKDSFIDSQGSTELFIHTNLNGVEELEDVRLAIVRYEVVSGLPLPDALDH
ncbi:hypothetical protein AU210_002133 [Fusarium oxysporum f. sp. radicis-cucumerinum]|uniref:Uncharacterized protein n=1 Tax=Fusarium oxysporum f. sp. radicis-cucumerinum TaxID=327505 RepID=A0A2H3HK62_FUSOX|nr:hypothetical protein AU210_002133 [Fusarium oxysporum f. sp. radicis-cucumerinum]